MSDLVRNILRFIIFIALQVYVLDYIPFLHRFIVPYIYFLFILWLPFSVSRMGLLVIGFLTGLTLDYFIGEPGLHTAACVLVAYLRPFIIGVLIPRDKDEFNHREPSPKALGWAPYSVYVLVLTLAHHLYLTFLQWLQFGTFLDFLIKVVATTGVSLLLIFTTELLFSRKVAYQTNTA